MANTCVLFFIPHIVVCYNPENAALTYKLD